jgi:hypothetical protein
MLSRVTGALPVQSTVVAARVEGCKDGASGSSSIVNQPFLDADQCIIVRRPHHDTLVIENRLGANGG